jgi:hypothetical protein
MSIDFERLNGGKSQKMEPFRNRQVRQIKFNAVPGDRHLLKSGAHKDVAQGYEAIRKRGR